MQYPLGAIMVVIGTSIIFLTPGILKFFSFLRPYFMKYLPYGVSFGILALILASIIELPVFFVRRPVLIALAAAVVEEPLKVFISKPFLKDKDQWFYTTMLLGFFFGTFESIYAVAIILIFGFSPLLALLRLFLVFLHTLWTSLSAVTLRRGLLSGLLFSISVHFLYDYSMLSILYSEWTVIGAIFSIFLTGIAAIVVFPTNGKSLSCESHIS